MRTLWVLAAIFCVLSLVSCLESNQKGQENVEVSKNVYTRSLDKYGTDSKEENDYDEDGEDDNEDDDDDDNDDDDDDDNEDEEDDNDDEDEEDDEEDDDKEEDDEVDKDEDDEEDDDEKESEKYMLSKLLGGDEDGSDDSEGSDSEEEEGNVIRRFGRSHKIEDDPEDGYDSDDGDDSDDNEDDEDDDEDTDGEDDDNDEDDTDDGDDDEGSEDDESEDEYDDSEESSSEEDSEEEADSSDDEDEVLEDSGVDLEPVRGRGKRSVRRVIFKRGERRRLKHNIAQLEWRIHKIRSTEYMAKVKCWADLADSMEEYAGRLKEKLAALEAKRKSKKDGKKGEGKEGEEGKEEFRLKKTDRRRRQTDTSDDRSKRECSYSESVSVPELAAKTVELEKEIQRQIAKKLEQRMEKEVSEKVDSAILQPQVGKVLDKDIRKAVQHQLSQAKGSNEKAAYDLQDRVKGLEKSLKSLRHEIENSPWTTFQQVMMEHAQKNNELGKGLTDADFDKLENMHKMTPAEREAFMQSLKGRVKLAETDEDEQEIQRDNEEVSVKLHPQRIAKKKHRPRTEVKKHHSKNAETEVKGSPLRVASKKPLVKEKALKKKKNRLHMKKRRKNKALKKNGVKKEAQKKGQLKKKGQKMRNKGRKRKGRRGRKGPRKGRKGPKRGPRKGRKGPKRGPRKGRKGPKGGRRKGRRGPKGGPRKGPKGGPRKGKRGPKGGPRKGPKELKRSKRALSSMGEWVSEKESEEAPTVSQTNDPVHERSSTLMVKHQLPLKKELGVRRSPLRQPPAVTSHPLEWHAHQQSNQPSTRPRRSSECPVIPAGARPFTFPATDEHEAEDSRKNDKAGEEDCSKCEEKVGEEVCGSNGKTYNSLCHAISCGRLKEMDVTFGSCENKNPCSHHHCSSSEVCAAMTYGPCLSVYATNGRRLPCRQYICVAKEDCGQTEYSEVCGVNSRTYPTLCHLQQSGVKLAYPGHCRADVCRGAVCGRDGVTYPSSCHARAHNVRIDYKGKCFAEDKEDHVRSCGEVRSTGMCSPASCKDAVIPEGACCPVCGGGVEVRPDAVQLAELAKDWPEINHLYMVENFLRRLVPKEMAAQCDLSLTLTDSGAIMLMLEAVQQKHSATCQAAAIDVAEKINSPSSSANTAVKPLARTARLLGSIGGNVIGNSIKSQTDIITQDVGKMKSDATSSVASAYNDNMKKVESYSSESSSSAESTFLVSTATVLTISLLGLLH